MGFKFIADLRQRFAPTWPNWQTYNGVLIDNPQLDEIERAADDILAEVGIRFNEPETLAALKSGGAKIEGDVARLDGAELRRIIRKSAPQQFTVRARNPSRDTSIGGSSLPLFAPMYGAPNIILEDGTRTLGSREVYQRLVSEAHAAPALTNTGHMICVMEDIKENRRPLEMVLAHMNLSDKPFMGSSASPSATQEVIDLTRNIINRPEGNGTCNLLHLINSTPPLTYGENPLKVLRTIALAGEASVITSYMMMGATSPVSGPASLAQGYAEVLAGVALTQIWNPGAPVAMGILGWPFDLRKMVPSYCDPASQWVQTYAAALGQRLGIPVRADGAVTSAKINDSQSGYESARNLSTAIFSGSHFVLHAAGWLEQGRCVSITKLKRDAENICNFFSEMPQTVPPPIQPDGAIVKEIEERLRRME